MGELIGKLGYDGRGWSMGLNQAVGEAQRAAHHIEGFFSKSFAGGLVGGVLGGLGLGSFEQVVDRVVHRASQIRESAEQLSLTTDEVQHIEHASTEAGLSFEFFGHSLAKIGNARKEAAQGNEDLRRTFARFRITLDDLQDPALRDIDLMEKLSAAIKGANLNSADRSELRDLLGGKGGDRLAAVFEKLNGQHRVSIISQQDIKDIDEAVKAVERLAKEVEALGAKPVAAAANVLGPKATLAERAKGVVGLLAAPFFPHFTDRFFPGSEKSMGPEQPHEGNHETTPAHGSLFRDKHAEAKLEEYGEAIGKLQESALKLQFAQLTPSGQMSFLARQLRDLQAEQKLLPKESTEFATLGAEINEKRLQLFNLQKQRQSLPTQFDSLAAVGGFLQGAGPVAGVSLQERIATATERTARAVENPKPDL